MGKNLKNADLVLRTGKLAFYLVPGNSAYTRMEGFTSLSTSKNPTEYERQYVDEDFKRTDITGYNVAIAYAIDRYKDHPVSDDIIGIHEGELLGQDAIRSIIQVDMTTAVQKSGRTWMAKGKMRDYAVIPDADGDTTDCMTYSGNFKTRGEAEDVEIITTDNWQTISVSGAQAAPVLKSVSFMRSGSSISYTPAFSGTTTNYTLPSGAGSITAIVVAESSTYTVMATCNGNSVNMNSGSGAFTVAIGDYIYITVNNNSAMSGSTNLRTYSFKVTAAS